jgi:hypothetical protein
MLAILLSATALFSQQQVTGDSLLTVSKYLDLEDVGDAKVSPDGKNDRLFPPLGRQGE